MWILQVSSVIALAWTEVQITGLSNTDDKTVSSAGVTFDGQQTFWIAYSVHDDSENESKVFVRSYNLGTSTLSSATQIGGAIGNDVFPQLAVTTDGDDLFIAASAPDSSCDADATPAGKVVVATVDMQNLTVGTTTVWDSADNGGDNDCTVVGRKSIAYDPTDDEVHLCWTAKSAVDEEVYCSDLDVGGSWSTVDYFSAVLDVNTTEETDHPGVCVDWALGEVRVSFHDIDDGQLWIDAEDSPSWELGEFDFTSPDNGHCWEGEDGFGEVWNDHTNPQQIHFSECVGGYVTDCILSSLWTESDEDPAMNDSFDEHLYPDVAATSDRWWVSWDARDELGVVDAYEVHVAWRCENDTDWVFDDPYVSDLDQPEGDQRNGFPHIATGVYDGSWWVGVPIMRHLVGGDPLETDLWFSFQSESGLDACP